MANLNGLGVSLHARKLRPCVIGFLVLLAGLLCVSRAFLHAAPVTLRFEAIVDNIIPLNGNAIPITVQTGDRVQAEITFEPFDAHTSSQNTNTIQESRAEFRVRSTLLHTETYSLRVSDHTPIDDAPPDETADHIFLGCSATGFVDCQPNTIPNDPMVRWDFSLSMFADGTILDGPDISDDAAVWNQFLPSSLVLTFRKTDGTDLALIAAGIESFTRVPEPSAMALGLVLFSFLSLRMRRTKQALSRTTVHYKSTPTTPIK